MEVKSQKTSRNFETVLEEICYPRLDAVQPGNFTLLHANKFAHPTC